MKDKALITFLVVEDDEIDIMNMERAFRKLGILNPLIIARNGQEALQKLESGDLPVQLAMIVDLNMPMYSGHDLVGKIRATGKWQHMPVFVLTTSHMASDIKEAREHCVNGYFLKEMSQEAFTRTIRTIVDFVNQAVWI